MLKRILLAVALVGACSTSLLAQGVSIIYSDTTIGLGAEVPQTASDSPNPTLVRNGNAADVVAATTFGNSITDANIGDTGTAFVLAGNGFDISQIENLQISSSDTSVAQITSADLLQFSIFGGVFTRWTEPSQATLAADGSSFDVFATSFGNLANDGNPASNGISAVAAAGDSGFLASEDAFIVGQFQYSIVGAGTTEFEFTDGAVFQGASQVFAAGNSDFVGASLTTVAVPEPSSAGLLALGLVGFAARRRRR